MQNRTRYIRLVLAAVGVWTVMLSFVVMSRATQSCRWQDDAVSDVSVTVLLLSALLALGGGCLAFRGMQYRGPAA